jgi:Raf kinase inhibitor-like YbhB/YbcL family protein
VIRLRATVLLIAVAGLAACHGAAPAPGDGKPKLDITCSGFHRGEIGKQFTCDGSNGSPELQWTAPPAGTQSFALIVIDPDAPGGEFVHWVLYNVPAETRELPEGLPKNEQLPDGSRQGRNDFDAIGYGGPCPPGHSAHRYVFGLYALDAKLNLPQGATRSQVQDAMKGHILAYGELIGRYSR